MASPDSQTTNAFALEARAVDKCFPGGVHALLGADLTVARGETVVLVGESGCGKTTLLRMFNRLERPTGGAIRIDGRPADDHEPIELRRRTGYVQQEGGLLPRCRTQPTPGSCEPRQTLYGPLFTSVISWHPVSP